MRIKSPSSTPRSPLLACLVLQLRASLNASQPHRSRPRQFLQLLLVALRWCRISSQQKKCTPSCSAGPSTSGVFLIKWTQEGAKFHCSRTTPQKASVMPPSAPFSSGYGRQSVCGKYPSEHWVLSNSAHTANRCYREKNKTPLIMSLRPRLGSLPLKTIQPLAN